MKKRVKGKKFSRNTNERKQLFRNLIRALTENGSIVTTETKAKVIKRQVERLITTGKNDNLTSFRKIIGETGNVFTTKQLLLYGKMFKNRGGGYTKIIKLNYRAGDNAPLVKLEWVEKLVIPEVVKETSKETSSMKEKITNQTKIITPVAKKKNVKRKKV